ncbi:pentapeptide repeat-containing protein [Scytonema sp. PCC 10023]|uniref:pentapeptide repeat-containing protein n=1 Tax=Scytonema sp. PCC 10023 TaxID=1680591 RepID=UPI0039C5EE84
MLQDFSGQNLKGRSFRGTNLTGANFSYADLPGVDFTNAKLRGTKFTGAKTGLQCHWVIGRVFMTLSVQGGIMLMLLSLVAIILIEIRSQNL